MDREDETPATFAELKPPGYWSKTLGRFVPVRRLTDEEAAERYREVDEFLEGTPWQLADRSWFGKVRGLLKRGG